MRQYISLSVNPTDTVKDIKKKYGQQAGLNDLNNWGFKYCSQLLSEESSGTLKDYNIQRNDILQLVHENIP